MINISSIFILIAGILWGTMSLFVRVLSVMGFSSMQMVFIRCIGTAITIGIFLAVSDRKALKIKIKDLWVFLGMGLISILCFNYCYFNSILLVSASTAAILLYTSPIFVVIFARIFFKEEITSKKIAALFIAFIGCILVANPRGNFNVSGIIYGVLSGVLYALYSIFGRIALNKYKTKTVLFYAFLFAFLGTLFVSEPYDALMIIKNGGVYIIGFIIVTVLVTTLLPYMFYTKGLEKTQAGNAAVIACIEPVVASVISVFVFKEPMTYMALLGIALVISAIIILNTGNKKV